MTRPSKFAPDFKARAIDLYRTSEGRTITAPYTSTGSPAPVCVDVAGRPPFSSVGAATRRAQPIAPQIRARLTQLAGPTVRTVPGDGSGQGRIGTPPQRLRHGYRRCISPDLRPWRRDLGPGRRGVSEELWTRYRRRNARLGARSPAVRHRGRSGSADGPGHRPWFVAPVEVRAGIVSGTRVSVSCRSCSSSRRPLNNERGGGGKNADKADSAAVGRT